MVTNLNFNNLNYNKSLEALLLKTEIWISDFSNYKPEIEFLKKIINTYPFKSNTRNLFENIQIFNRKLENIEFNRLVILKKTTPIKLQLIEKTNKQEPQIDVKFIDIFNNIEDEVLTFNENYKSLKNTIYNYFNALLVT